MISEPKLMVSDSIRDDIDLEDSQQSVEPIVGIVTFVPLRTVSESLAFTSILRYVKINKNKIKMSVTSRYDAGLKLLQQFRQDNFNLYQSLFIEYGPTPYKLDLINTTLKKVELSEIDNDKQTCICSVTFKRIAQE